MNGSMCRRSLLGALAMASLTLAPARAVTIDWVTVGDAGNAADTNGNGAVGYEYDIGKYEITIGQYAEFLNAAAKSDPYGLWNTDMTRDDIGGIARSGTSGAYVYTVIGPSGTAPAGANSPANRPVTYVSWFDAARFTNWLQNGQGNGSTETGAYTLNGATSGNRVARNPGSLYYIPTQDEWYKAAYYKGGSTNAGYWDYATQSDTAPGNTIGGSPNQANYLYGGTYSVTQSSSQDDFQNFLTNVGAFAGSASAYGTFDQNGNVAEWNDWFGTAQDGTFAGMRGGDYNHDDSRLVADTNAFLEFADFESNNIGFRLMTLSAPASVPEINPAGLGSVAALLTGALGLLERRRLKAKAA